jgi:hypothetical protein
MLRTRNLTLSSTPTLLTTTDEIDTSNTISIQNTSDSETLYLGGAAVSSSSYGVRLLSGQIWSADLGAYDQLYAVGTGTVAVLILER